LDDEQTVRNVASTALERAGFSVIATATAEEALLISTSDSVSIGLFITDHLLPEGFTGREVAERIQQVHPEVRVLHISGYLEEQLRRDGDLTAGGFFLRKPFYPRDLVAKVTEILGQQ